MNAVRNNFTNMRLKYLLDTNLNIPGLDDKPCRRCHKIPPVFKIQKGKKTLIDRSSRVDCDAGKEEISCAVTYCRECWFKEVYGKKEYEKYYTKEESIKEDICAKA